METTQKASKYLNTVAEFTADVHTQHGYESCTYSLVEFFGTWSIIRTTSSRAELDEKWEGGSTYDALQKFDHLKRCMGVKL